MHLFSFLYSEPQGQSWAQFGELALALVLSTLIGLEREYRAKSAGLRTHTLVVFGYAQCERRILSEQVELQVRYTPGKGAVEKVMQMCTGSGYVIQELAVGQAEASAEGETRAIRFHVSGRRGVEALLVAIADIKGVVTARLSRARHGKA